MESLAWLESHCFKLDSVNTQHFHFGIYRFRRGCFISIGKKIFYFRSSLFLWRLSYVLEYCLCGRKFTYFQSGRQAGIIRP